VANLAGYSVGGYDLGHVQRTRQGKTVAIQSAWCFCRYDITGRRTGDRLPVGVEGPRGRLRANGNSFAAFGRHIRRRVGNVG